MHQAALFDANRIFDGKRGVDTDMKGAALVLEQDNGNRAQLDEQGAILLQLTLRMPDETRGSYSFPALIEENVLARIQSALSYATWVLDHIDATERLAHLAVAARI